MTSPPSRLPPDPQPTMQATPASNQVSTATEGRVTGLLGKTEKSDFIRLNSGNELSESAAIALAASRPVQWIVLAGPIDSGKTTLLASLYEMFQWKTSVEGFQFAGSNTLPAFEEICFLSRRNSGNEKPDTERTRYQGPEPYYLHLRIRSLEGLRPFVDFLFTDVSGELFEHASNSTTECKEMIFVKRASHLLVLLDSEKGVQKENRWAIVEKAKGLLRSCLDSNVISPGCAVTIVWSRFDYFVAEITEPGHKAYREEVEKQLRAIFGSRISNLRFTELAARPSKAPQLKVGYGVKDLLKQWGITALEHKPLQLLPDSFSGTRESEVFGERYFSALNENDKADE